MMEKRVPWIDSLKGFAIFCVTFGHLACEYSLEKHIYSFHMFLFFFLSGYLHHDNCPTAWGYFLKKVKTILVPFLCWNLLSIFLEGCFVGFSPGHWKELFLIKGNLVWNRPIWFLWVLFATEILFGILKRKLPYCNLICIVISLLCGFYFVEKRVTLYLNLLPFSVFAFALGNSFKQMPEKITEFFRRTYLDYLIMVVFLGINLWLGDANIRIIYTDSNFGNYSYFILAAITGTMFYLLLFRKVPWLGTSRIMTYIGQKSLNIMALQYILFAVYDGISERYFHMSVVDHRNSWKALLFSLLTIALICLVSEGMKKLEKKWNSIRKVRTLFGLR